MHIENEYLSIPQVAKILGVSRITIYKKVKKGEIKATKIGRSYAISKEYIKKNVVNIKGRPLNDEEKKEIESAVKKTFEQYGDVIKRLGEE